MSKEVKILTCGYANPPGRDDGVADVCEVCRRKVIMSPVSAARRDEWQYILCIECVLELTEQREPHRVRMLNEDGTMEDLK